MQLNNVTDLIKPPPEFMTKPKRVLILILLVNHFYTHCYLYYGFYFIFYVIDAITAKMFHS